ncbi:MAG: helix-hairpin-helix domain-containing protein [Gammaproteobacteria bacterium]|nr:helix-hairpin-helix domain-containing protein [Gammaproteobacteria bacterium]
MKRFILSCFAVLFMFSHVSFAAGVDDAKSPHHNRHAAAKMATQPVDINHADITQLTSLKGVGPAKANAIIAYRTKNGLFKTTADLTKVKGIKAKTLARLEAKNPNLIVAH